MIDEGYIKYQCNWIVSPPLETNLLSEINFWRSQMYQLGLIGEYDNGIGFGNISIRDCAPEYFIISGTQTGNLETLNGEHYTKVINFNFTENSLTCQGPIKASSESLTHAAIYTANPQVNAVIHVHHLQLWQQLLDRVPTTARNCAYGTPEMAEEIMRLSAKEELQTEKIIVMSGHEEGIITFGISLAEAANFLHKYYEKVG